jgi:hypothetical protein
MPAVHVYVTVLTVEARRTAAHSTAAHTTFAIAVALFGAEDE